MKRSLIILLLLLLAALSAEAADKAGEVAFVSGSAFIQRGTAQLPAALRTPVMQGDTVVTGKGAALKLLMLDDSVFTLAAESRMEINEYVYDPKEKRAQSAFKLLLGKLRAAIGRAKTTVSTDTAVAGIKGTVFEIWWDAELRTTWLAVFEGEVEFRNIRTAIKGVRILRRGEMSSVRTNEPPTPPVPIPPPKPGQGAPGGGEGGSVPPLEPLAGGGVVVILPGGLQLPLTPPIQQQPPGTTTRVNMNLVFP